MSTIKFHINAVKQYEHYSSSVFSITKLKTNMNSLASYNKNDIFTNIISSKYYLWNYEFYPQGYPFEGENLKLHGPFNRDKIVPSDYLSFSYQAFFNDVLAFIINEISFTNPLMKEKDEMFLKKIIKELIFSFNDMIYYKLSLKLDSMTEVNLAPYRDKISKWHPYSIFKSYLVFDSKMTTIHIIQIGDD